MLNKTHFSLRRQNLLSVVGRHTQFVMPRRAALPLPPPHLCSCLNNIVTSSGMGMRPSSHRGGSNVTTALLCFPNLSQLLKRLHNLFNFDLQKQSTVKNTHGISGRGRVRGGACLYSAYLLIIRSI